jgi:hypothetical protein
MNHETLRETIRVLRPEYGSCLSMNLAVCEQEVQAGAFDTSAALGRAEGGHGWFVCIARPGSVLAIQLMASFPLDGLDEGVDVDQVPHLSGKTKEAR